MLIPSLYFVLSLGLTKGHLPGPCLDTNIFINKPKIDYESLLTQIADYRTVECGFTGYRGFKSVQCERYYTLLANSTDLQLFHFSSHPSPAVRVYAIKGLAERKSQYLPEVLEARKHDKAIFTSRCGCVLRTMPVSLWIEVVLLREYKQP